MNLEQFKSQISGTQFEADFLESMYVNGNPMSRAIWNLIISKRDLSMWAKHRMKPHRFWKVSNVKIYFGIKGSADKLLEQIIAYKECVDQLYNNPQIEE